MFVEIKINAKQEQQRDEFIYILEELYTILLERKTADPKESYVASLYHKGINKILQKIAEESYEVILASYDVENMFKTGHNHSNEERKKYIAFNKEEQVVIDALIKEVADLWFHFLVFFAFLNLDFLSFRWNLLCTCETHMFSQKKRKTKAEAELFAKDNSHFHDDRIYRAINSHVFKLIKEVKSFKNLPLLQAEDSKYLYVLIVKSVYVLDVSLAKLPLIPEIGFYDVAKVLQQRMGISGLDEKSARNKQ